MANKMEKPVKKEFESAFCLKAQEGYLLPVFYGGRIVRVVSGVWSAPFELAKLPYESLCNIRMALKLNQVEMKGAEK